MRRARRETISASGRHLALIRGIVRAHLHNPLTYQARGMLSGRPIFEGLTERNTVNILIPEFDLACYDGPK